MESTFRERSARARRDNRRRSRRRENARTSTIRDAPGQRHRHHGRDGRGHRESPHRSHAPRRGWTSYEETRRRPRRGGYAWEEGSREHDFVRRPVQSRSRRGSESSCCPRHQRAGFTPEQIELRRGRRQGFIWPRDDDDRSVEEHVPPVPPVPTPATSPSSTIRPGMMLVDPEVLRRALEMPALAQSSGTRPGTTQPQNGRGAHQQRDYDDQVEPLTSGQLLDLVHRYLSGELDADCPLARAHSHILDKITRVFSAAQIAQALREPLPDDVRQRDAERAPAGRSAEESTVPRPPREAANLVHHDPSPAASSPSPNTSSHGTANGKPRSGPAPPIWTMFRNYSANNTPVTSPTAPRSDASASAPEIPPKIPQQAVQQNAGPSSSQPQELASAPPRADERYETFGERALPFLPEGSSLRVPFSGDSFLDGITDDAPEPEEELLEYLSPGSSVQFSSPECSISQPSRPQQDVNQAPPPANHPRSAVEQLEAMLPGLSLEPPRDARPRSRTRKPRRRFSASLTTLTEADDADEPSPSDLRGAGNRTYSMLSRPPPDMFASGDTYGSAPPVLPNSMIASAASTSTTYLPRYFGFEPAPGQEPLWYLRGTGLDRLAGTPVSQDSVKVGSVPVRTATLTRIPDGLIAEPCAAEICGGEEEEEEEEEQGEEEAPRPAAPRPPPPAHALSMPERPAPGITACVSSASPSIQARVVSGPPSPPPPLPPIIPTPTTTPSSFRPQQQQSSSRLPMPRSLSAQNVTMPSSSSRPPLPPALQIPKPPPPRAGLNPNLRLQAQSQPALRPAPAQRQQQSSSQQQQTQAPAQSQAKAPQTQTQTLERTPSTRSKAAAPASRPASRNQAPATTTTTTATTPFAAPSPPAEKKAERQVPRSQQATASSLARSNSVRQGQAGGGAGAPGSRARSASGRGRGK